MKFNVRKIIPFFIFCDFFCLNINPGHFDVLKWINKWNNLVNNNNYTHSKYVDDYDINNTNNNDNPVSTSWGQSQEPLYSGQFSHIVIAYISIMCDHVDPWSKQYNHVTIQITRAENFKHLGQVVWMEIYACKHNAAN